MPEEKGKSTPSQCYLYQLVASEERDSTKAHLDLSTCYGCFVSPREKQAETLAQRVQCLDEDGECPTPHHGIHLTGGRENCITREPIFQEEGKVKDSSYLLPRGS
ncbi:unnamed protein product [Caretta caretta]